jgi:purine-binding chemotaxis protein CheW
MKQENKHVASTDWQDVHRRLDTLRQAIEADWTLEPARIAQILKQRTQALAAPLQAEDAGAQLDIIEFMLAEERYAITAAQVREVCPLIELTPVPCTPNHVLGIIDVRGEFVSVIDIKKFFGISAQGLSDLNKVIVLASDGMAFGILVDVIVAARALPRAELQPPLPGSTLIRADYLLGITAGHMAVIDADRLLADRSLIVNEEI